MKGPDLILSATPALVLATLVTIVVRTRSYREFPSFLGYMLYALLAAGLRVLVLGRAMPYYWLYWITEGIYGAAEGLVITEVFHRVFALEYANRRWFRTLLPSTILLIFGFSLWQTVFHPLGRRIPPVVNAIYWFDFGVHLLEGAILALLVILRTVFPVRWRPREFGILIGFGVAASFTLFAYLMRFEWGNRYELFFRYGPPAGYILATLVWLHAFLRPLEARPRAEMDAEEMLGIIRRYQAMLEKMKRFVGMKEAAVERWLTDNAAHRGEW